MAPTGCVIQLCAGYLQILLTSDKQPDSLVHRVDTYLTNSLYKEVALTVLLYFQIRPVKLVANGLQRQQNVADDKYCAVCYACLFDWWHVSFIHRSWSKMENNQPQDKIYHEKQVRELCALHALNSLFQDSKAYTQGDLDDICYRLSPDKFINPHRSLLGLGNYDVNVIMAALQMKNHEAIWFDKRKDPSCLNLQKIAGFILNIPTDYKIGFIQLPLRRKHWIAVQQICGLYYNLDSKLDSPESIGKDTEVLEFFRKQLSCKDREIFVVVSDEVAKESSWKRQGSLPKAVT